MTDGAAPSEATTTWLSPLKKEPHHFGRCVRTPRVAVRAGATATEPRVAAAMDKPVFKQQLPGCVTVEGPRKGVTTRRLALLGLNSSALTAFPVRGTGKGVDAIARMNSPVAIAVEHDGWRRMHQR